MPDWFPYTIRYIGDCGISGHGYSMRGMLAALHEVGVRRDQIDIMPWPPTMSLQEDWFFDRFLRSRDDRPSLDDTPRVNLIDTRLPDVHHFWTKGWHNVIVAPWRRVPDGAAAIINRCEEVWATSENVAAALRDGGVTLPIFIIPRALQPELLKTPPKEVAPDIAPELHPYVGPHEFKHTSPVYFYYVGTWDAGKNVETLLKAFLAVGWGPNDPVELILHSPYNSGGAQQQIDALLPKQPPVVRLLQKPKSYGWVCKLHQMNHVLVSAARDESFPPWEAAAVGNLVVMPTCVDPIPGALTFNLDDVDDLSRQFKVAFDLIRSGWLGTDWGHAVRKMVSPAAVGELLKQRLTALKGELEA
jgi:glycosyltransferase involved in cell wall biosynthesis